MIKTLSVTSINTGNVQRLPVQRHGEDVHSAIRKLPTHALRLYLGINGLDGDRQADLSVYGGELKAVYFYPSVHYEHWASQYDRAFAPGIAFGENVTVDCDGGRLPEEHIYVGETWQWDEAIIEVTKPRQPCYKLGLHLGNGIARQMIENCRCGWYAKVLQPGMVSTSGTLQLLNRPSDTPSILEVFREKMGPRAQPHGLTVAD